jgi:hypothetical protein
MGERLREEIEMQKEANQVPYEKRAPKAEEGERIDPPKPADGGAIRGAPEDIDIAHEIEEEASAARRERRTARFLVRKADAPGWKGRRQSPIVDS